MRGATTTDGAVERGRRRWVAASAVAAGAVALIALFERWVGFRSPVFAFELHFIGMGAAAWIDPLLAPGLEGQRFDVSAREERLYRRLGAAQFMRLLRAIGWTRALRDPRVFDGSRRTLASYERATRHGENAHLVLLVLSALAVAWSLARGWWDAALWIGSMAVVFHLYPIFLQRMQRARLRRLLGRRAAR